jgi:hypothetical protein
LRAWKKKQDDEAVKAGKQPNYRKDGSRLEWSDISDKRDAYWDDHKTHDTGNCIDIRPSRKNYDPEHPKLQYNWRNYDQGKTKELIELAIQMGAHPVFFNDPDLCTGKNKICATSTSAHANHVHLCFGGGLSTKDSRNKTKATCDTYQYDPNICGGL